MSFTDDDLKRLKEWTEDLSDKTFPGRREIIPLIARLEAAEECAKEYAPDTPQGFVRLDRWRKASGKEQ